MMTTRTTTPAATRGTPSLAARTAPPTTGTGIFYDGLTAGRRSVAVELAGDVIAVTLREGPVIARWRAGRVYRLATSNEVVLRIASIDSEAAARLEIHDPALAGALSKYLSRASGTALTVWWAGLKLAACGLAAAGVVLGGAAFGVPRLAGAIAARLPVALDVRLGAAVDPGVRRAIDPAGAGRAFECGEGAKAGRAALGKLMATLEEAAQLPLPLRVVVARSPLVNALTLPGGRIYVFSGLLAKAQTADELAGVISHEIGHVAHRDGTRAAVERTGLSLLAGALFGTFSGGAAAAAAGRVLETAYSRAAETAADDFGARLMYRVGGDPRALGAVVLRISGQPAALPHFLLDHPTAQERADALARIAPPARPRPLMTAAEWTALKGICTGG